MIADTSKPLRLEDAALAVGVSTATIRNWIKAGNLRTHKQGWVTVDSLALLQIKLGESGRLSKRANKSLKDTHDHDGLTIQYLKRINDTNVSLDKVADEYEQALSDSYRNKEGIYYTPTTVVNDLLKTSDGVLKKTFCDPCCGSGAFITRAIELGFQPENIYGFDTDPVAVELTKAQIFKITGYNSKNIVLGDFLDIASSKDCPSFDYIYTNPPWGKKITKSKKLYYSDLFNAGNSTDTCALFFYAGLKCLVNNGSMGFIVPEAFFNIAAFESARRRMVSLKAERFIDYGKPFKGLYSKAYGFVLRQTPSNKTDVVECSIDSTKITRDLASFAINPKCIINSYCEHESASIIDYLYSLPHTTLAGKASWGLGIVTGDNDRYVSEANLLNHIPVNIGSDIKKGSILDAKRFIPSDLSLYQQVSPLMFFKADCKLIYKFISSRLCFYCDQEQRFFLNSANMLIPNRDIGVSGEQLCDLLNSDVINWIFKNIFNTHKVLRSDLESLPLHTDYFKIHKSFKESAYLGYLGITIDKYGAYRIKK